jgi:hypothetical protein
MTTLMLLSPFARAANVPWISSEMEVAIITANLENR